MIIQIVIIMHENILSAKQLVELIYPVCIICTIPDTFSDLLVEDTSWKSSSSKTSLSLSEL